jgi:phosphohistidine phosphatase
MYRPPLDRGGMELLLVRHGPSESRDPRRWPIDEDRPLSATGVDATEAAARGLARLAPRVTRVASSPAERARATAVLFHRALGVRAAIDRWAELAPEAPAEPILARVAAEGRRADGLLLVSHEPILSELVGVALTGEAVSLVHFARAGVADLVFDRAVRPGAGRLDWLISRRGLAQLAR